MNYTWEAAHIMRPFLFFMLHATLLRHGRTNHVQA